MELVPDHVQRALAYLHLLKKRGIDPRRNQVEDFARTQPPRGSRQETPWAALALLTGLTVARDAEPVVDYLVAMGWAEIVSPGENVRLTGFGEAFLVGVELEDAAAPADPAVADVVLEPKDPLVYVHLTRYLAQAGAGLLVDPYFKAKFVPWLAETTSIRQVLVSSRHRGTEHELKLLGVALATVPNADELAVRASDSKELHDRCVIGENGSVIIIGASVTGVGKNLTSMITPTTEVTAVYRDKYRKLWESAAPVVPQSPGTPDGEPGKAGVLG